MTYHTPKDLLKKFERIADVLAEDVDALSDAQVLQEAKDDGIDTEKLASEFRSSALSLIAKAKRERLSQAQSSLAESQQFRANRNSIRPSLHVIKRQIQKIMTLKPALAVSFRDEKEMSATDWQSLWDDFVEMGELRSEDDVS